MKRIWKSIRQPEAVRVLRGIPKSLYVCFKYLPFRKALRLPILLASNVKIARARGQISVSDSAGFGSVRIGFGDVAVFDRWRSRTILALHAGGHIIFDGRAMLGHGSRLSVCGELRLGDSFKMSAESTIICRKSICFGSNTLVSWEVLVMDSDFHQVFAGETRLNPDKDVVIGDGSWIGCRSTIHKGTRLPRNTVVAANSVVGGRFRQPGTLVAGAPASVALSGITWAP